MKSRKHREKTQSRNTKDKKTGARALGLGSGAIVLIIMLMILIPVGLVVVASGNLQLGGVDISVIMTTGAYNEGALVYDENPNNPFYVAGQRVDAIEVGFEVSANGDYVDWSTLTINADLKATASGTTTEIVIFDTMGTGLSELDGGYVGSSSYMVENLETYLSGSPDETLDNGVEVHYLTLSIEVSASIDDNRGHHLTDTTTVQTIWKFQDDTGAVSANTETSVKPEFITKPESTYSITEGDSLVLEWAGVDDNPSSYEISTFTLNDGYQIKASGTWTTDTKPQYDVGTFRSVDPGDYVVSVACKLIDTDGQTAVSTTEVSVTVPTSPLIYFEKMIDPPTSANPGASNIELFFKPRSENPSSYQVYQNGVIIQEGSWPGGDLFIEVSYIYPGKNIFRCVVFDTSGYSATNTHTITATTDPYREIGPVTDLVYSPFGGEGLSIGLWLSAGVLGLAAVVYAFRWWRDE